MFLWHAKNDDYMWNNYEDIGLYMLTCYSKKLCCHGNHSKTAEVIWPKKYRPLFPNRLGICAKFWDDPSKRFWVIAIQTNKQTSKREAGRRPVLGETTFYEPGMVVKTQKCIHWILHPWKYAFRPINYVSVYFSSWDMERFAYFRNGRPIQHGPW